MNKIKKPGPTEALPGSWTYVDYPEDHHRQRAAYRELVFDALSRQAENVGQWNYEMGGTRLWCLVPTKRFGSKRGPFVLRAYFDPMFGRFHVDTAEISIRRALRRMCGVEVRQYLRSRRQVQTCQVVYLETGPTGRAFQVAQRVADPCEVTPDKLVHVTMRHIDLVVTEAVLLLECLG